jgi:hypothetical protein
MSNFSWLAAAAAAAALLIPAATLAQSTQCTECLYTDTFSQTQLRNFARASVELDALHTGIGAYPSQEWLERASQSARVILERHDLDAATYNAIATQARTDRALSARIRALRMRDNVGS